ncbi:hypothetical protein BT67DRAFT_433135 [Trichocladium antarcticum]|uniref:Uncharacterized protein n=1 Tax=Trichocladium antarcticum TaxID=1450529 RepID=A0AAN6ZFD7_9PEZI|nr:hypothetical protein BT67DRAFT_433135 [Trichocladium antarcticum]
MRSVWSCSSCVALLFIALLGREATASRPGRPWKDDVHRVTKAQVTAQPAHLARRDEGGACPAAHAPCPAALGGGCCPSRYACAADSCYATTAGPTTACGKSGYFACAATDGEPVTSTVTQTLTTTSGTQTVTTTQTAVTVATPTRPSGSVTDDANIAVKFIPTTVPKVPASSQSGEPDGGGLSGGALGGIIAGVVVLLIVVVVAAFFIIRRLKHVEDVMESRRDSSSAKKTQSQSQAQMEHYGRHLHSPDDDMSLSIDPLMVPTNTTNNTSAAGTPQPGTNPQGRTDSVAGFVSPSPNLFNTGAFPDARHARPDSNQDGYFDPHRQQQQPMLPARMRGSADSTRTTTHNGYVYARHWRHQSNTSELSADGSDTGGGGASANANANAPAELVGSRTTGAYVELPSSDPHAPAPTPQTHHGRPRSGSSPVLGYAHVCRGSDAADSPASPASPGSPGSPRSPGIGGLGSLDEEGEGILHGPGEFGREAGQGGGRREGTQTGQGLWQGREGVQQRWV